MFSQLGFFRFVAGYDSPIPSLEAAILRHGSVGGSLIVLPEGFNIGKYYRDAGPCNYDATVLGQLRDLALVHGVTFVAGVIVQELKGPMPPLSSACLVTATGSALLCRKHGSDGSLNYTPYKADPVGPNPILYGDASIAALVCMDCDDPNLYRPIENKLAAIKRDKIVCVPACMNKVYGADAIAMSWKDAWVIVSNSDPKGCRSFVSFDGSILTQDGGESDNIIVLYEVVSPH